MLLLYDSPVSGNCYKARLLLAQLGSPCRRRSLDVADRSNRPEVLGGLNPALRVPTLVLDDGRPLAESGAILWYFGEGTRFVPDDPYERAQVLQWMFFEQYDHEPSIAVVRFWLAYSGRPEQFADRIEERTAAGYRALDAMERHLTGRAFLVGEAVRLADIELYAYTHVAHEGGFNLTGRPAIQCWLARVAGQPGHVPTAGRPGRKADGEHGRSGVRRRGADPAVVACWVARPSGRPARRPHSHIDEPRCHQPCSDHSPAPVDPG